MKKTVSMDKPKILGTGIDPTSYKLAASTILAWQSKRESRYICAANVHMVMEAYDSKDYQQIINNADIVTPDGMPLVWTLRKLGYPDQQRVYGPDLTIELLKMAQENQIPVGFFGSAPDVIARLKENVRATYPGIQLAYSVSPPFRQLSPEEDEAIVEEINQSGARILFVGLGCPKQEKWMADHKDRINAVMVGVGAAFDFLAGTIKQAPNWMQKLGLEWFFRLIIEPKRLWRRYVYHNPRFVIKILKQIAKQRKIK